MYNNDKIIEILTNLRNEQDVSISELARRVGMAKSAVSRYFNKTRQFPLNRAQDFAKALNTTTEHILGIKTSEPPTPPSNGYPTVRIPVLGDVAAGVPILAQQDIVGYEDIPADMAKTGEYFGLKIKGDSMEPKIHDNDIVIVKSMSDAENNDIVIAMINNEATCKRLHKYSNSVVLTAINSDYKPIEVTPDENIQILGKVVMSISKF